MAAQEGSPADFDGAHGTMLLTRHGSAVDLPVLRAALAEDVGHFQGRPITAMRAAQEDWPATPTGSEWHDRGTGDSCVDGGGVQAAMSQQCLDDANIGSGVEQVSCEAVAQHSQVDRFADS